MTSTEFTISATDRANKILSFNASGEIAIAQELGTFKGNSATTTTAAYVVRDIVKGTTTAQANNIYICIQASPIGTALTNTAYWVLIVDAVAAASSATAAAASAVDATNNGAAKVTLAAAQVALATTQANNAATSASTASGHKDTASTKATEAASSATAAASSATAAASSADAFDDVYLGTKSSDPSADNDGDSLAEGMLYFNSTSDSLRVYNGSSFQDAAVDTTTFLTLTATQTLTNKTLTSPKIGTSILDTAGNELALLTATSSAVNEFTIANAATNNAPRLSATGETNVDLDLLAKGTGHVTVRGNTNSGALQLNCEANTHGQILIAQPHSAAVTNILTLPAGASSTLVSLVSTDTLTNKTLTAPKINEDVAVTSTATELNLLDGVSGLVQADFTKLAAVDSTAAELNLLDAVARGKIIYGNASGASALLAPGSNGTVLTSDGTDISWAAGGISDNAITLAKMASGTDGNIISYDTSGNPVAVATGNDGQVLTSAGAGQPPVFEDAPGGGKIAQVKSIVKTDYFTTTTAMPSFTDVTGLSLAITPSASNSKIMVTFTCFLSNSGTAQTGINLVRGSTSILKGDDRGTGAEISGMSISNLNQYGTSSVAISFLDSPGTTNATTYKIQLGSYSSSRTAGIGGAINGNSGNAASTPSTLTLMEVLA